MCESQFLTDREITVAKQWEYLHIFLNRACSICQKNVPLHLGSKALNQRARLQTVIIYCLLNS